jgi:hypothetical protein
MVGSQTCFRQYPAVTGAITLVSPSSTYMDVAGTNGLAAGTFASSGVAGDSACIWAASTTQYQGYVEYGSWINQ